MNKYQYLIWDFNGTILNDVPLCLDILNKMLTKYGKPNVDAKHYRQVFRFPVKEYYDLVGLDDSVGPFHALADEFITEYNQRFHEVQLFPGLKQYLQELRDNNIQLIIISATEHQLLMKQLEMLEVSWMFNAIVGIDNILGASKLLTALKWFSQQDFDPQCGCLIGDTTHDFDVANALGLDCILLAQGHNDFHRLSQTPATVISDWTKLKDIL